MAAALAALLVVSACGSDDPAPTQPPAQPTTPPATATPEPPATDPPPEATAAPATPEPTAVPPTAAPAATEAPPAEPPQDLAIDFSLPSASGETVTLASYRGEQAVILVFSRGLW